MSFEEFIRMNYEVRETTRSDEIRICCDFCDDDKFHGYISTSKEVFHCFRCHASQAPGKRGYSAFFFLRKVHRLSYTEALEILRSKDEVTNLLASTKRDKLSDVVERLSEATEEFVEEEKDKIEFPESYLMSPDHKSTINKKAWKYIKKRLGKKTSHWVRELEFRYCTRGPYSGRILLPVYDEFHRLIYFQGRAFMPETLIPPYLNPPLERPLFSPTGFLGELVILVEGYFDALAIGNGGVAVFGSNLTDKQFKTIIELAPSRLIMCFDDDAAGRHGLIETRHRLRPYIDNIMAVVGLARDPGEIGPKVRKLIKHCAIPFNDALEVRLILDRKNLM